MISAELRPELCRYLGGDEARGFIGIKDIINAEGVNKFPTNRTDTTINPLYTIICILVVLFGHIVGFINGIIQFINGLLTLICNIEFPVGICAESYKNSVLRVRYEVQRWDNDDGWVGDDDGDSEFITVDPSTISDGDVEGTGSCNKLEDLFNGNDSGAVNTSTGWKSIGAKLTNCTNYTLSSENTSNGQSYSNIKFCRLGDNLNTGQAIQGGAPLPSPPSVPSQVGRFPQDSDLGNNFKIGTSTSDSENAAAPNGYVDFWCPTTEGVIQGPRGFPGGNNYCYNNDQAIYDPDGVGDENFRRWKYSNGNVFNLSNCTSITDEDKKDECDGLKLFGKCWTFEKKCLFSESLCSQCIEPCSGDGFSCCSNDEFGCPENNGVCGGSDNGCSQGRCCQRVGLIPLKCNDEGVDLKISLINLENFSPACNVTYVKTNACANCGGRQTPGIKDWASCVLEPVAVFLRMLKFDFYNDWVGGTLYFPLVKRKYKLKKNKRKFGQIKKDKFCDFDCKERVIFEQNQFGIPVPVFSENF